MATIKAFKGIRPAKEYAKDVAALPYDVVNSDEAREMVKGKPYSFLHVDKAEVDLDPSVNIYDDSVYEKAKENLYGMIDKGILIKDTDDCFYIYELTMEGRKQTGLVVCTSIDEYIDGTIKKHELTREDKEQDRIRHVDTLNANTGPIFLAYKYNEEINNIIENWKNEHSSEYDFLTDEGTNQRVWVINDNATIEKLTSLFDKVSNFYIADGHHRNASAVKVGLKRRNENPNYTGEEEFNYYLSVLFPDSQLAILDYNRVIKDFNGLSKEEFIEKLSEKFEIKKENGMFKPSEIHTFGFYTDKQWYSMKAKKEIIKNDVIESLDVSILQNNVLVHILEIDDIRTSKRIDFVGGIRGLSELEKRVDSGEMVGAFAMYPTSMAELMAIADENKIMPPKSTWFEPKLQSGLFIHTLD